MMHFQLAEGKRSSRNRIHGGMGGEVPTALEGEKAVRKEDKGVRRDPACGW